MLQYVSAPLVDKTVTAESIEREAGLTVQLTPSYGY